MAPLRDTLLPEERAEFDALMQLLPPAERGMVRILEIFMTHQLNQAAMLNAEIRGIAARQAADLVDHERRLRQLERQAHYHGGMAPAAA